MSTAVVRHRRSRGWRRPSIPVYIGAVAVLALGLSVVAVSVVDARPSLRTLPLWVLTLMFFATASYPANFAVGRQVHSFQLCDVPRLLGLVFASPATLVCSRLLGALPALVLVRQQRGRKLLFNLASFGVEVSTAVLVFAALAPGGVGLGPSLWPAAITSTAAADLVSILTVGIVIALSEGRPLRDVLPGPTRVAMGTSVVASILGLTVATTYGYSTSAAVLLVLLVALAMVVARSYAAVVERNQEAVRLQRLLSELGPVTVRRPEMQRVLQLVRELFGVEQVHLVRYGRDGVEVCSINAPVAEGVPAPAEGPTPGQWALLDAAVAAGRPAPSPAPSPLALPLPGRRRVRALASPLTGRMGVSGAVLVAEPMGAVRNLTNQDLRLLMGVTTQVAQALERGEELETLARAATHDAVTGALNVDEFRRRAGASVATGRPHLVLLVDVARLRSVNDVFGRGAGDALLVEVALRLAAAAGGDGAVGRLGGHHFALLLAQPVSAGATSVAQRLRTALQAPFDRAGVGIEIGVHVGVARAPVDGTDPELLLRRAEAALDDAKQEPSGVAVFQPSMERDAVRPLRLVTDLKAVLDGAQGAGRLRLVYQPKVDLRTGRLYGVEALARWDHPELGEVSPDEFVRIAEGSGLIHPLTEWVLATSLRDCAAWHERGHDTTVAVNLSPRNLLDPELVGRVRDALAESGVPARALTLELTETCVMAQPERSTVVLDALRAVGVLLSVDDFGTGYSSLAYLRELPVDEVKLDRSFVVPLGCDDADGKAEALVRQTIRLAQSLGLRVVVEGVDDQRLYDTLRAMGADSVQGWFTGRPVDAAAVHGDGSSSSC